MILSFLHLALDVISIMISLVKMKKALETGSPA